MFQRPPSASRNCSSAPGRSGNSKRQTRSDATCGERPPTMWRTWSFAISLPERPGALLQFLDALGGRWNISLFHYRNHGADFGRVLAAFEVPDAERAAFEAFLSGLGYRFQLDEDNDAYRRFLGAAR